MIRSEIRESDYFFILKSQFKQNPNGALKIYTSNGVINGSNFINNFGEEGAGVYLDDTNV